MSLRFLFLIPVALLGACAASSVPWQNPGIPKDQWSRDWSDCRRWAESQVGYRDEDSSSSPFRNFDRTEAKRQASGYASMCMTDRGYVPVRSR